MANSLERRLAKAERDSQADENCDWLYLQLKAAVVLVIGPPIWCWSRGTRPGALKLPQLSAPWGLDLPADSVLPFARKSGAWLHSTCRVTWPAARCAEAAAALRAMGIGPRATTGKAAA